MPASSFRARIEEREPVVSENRVPRVIPPGDKEDGREAAHRDALITDYRAILAELALLTTVSVLLFGFLLGTISSESSRAEEWIQGAAMVLVAGATMVFILPVAYHHIQFPYEDFDKFQARSHRWILLGLPLLGSGLYLSLCLAIWSLFDTAAIAIAALPFAAVAVIFILRKGQL
jgi:hypothetical protein